MLQLKFSLSATCIICISKVKDRYSLLDKSDKKTIGERVDEVKDDVSDTAHDIKNSVKKAVEDTGDAVADLIHTKK